MAVKPIGKAVTLLSALPLALASLLGSRPSEFQEDLHHLRTPLSACATYQFCQGFLLGWSQAIGPLRAHGTMGVTLHSGTLQLKALVRKET